MIRLSSSLTLFFALFLPVFWFVFFGSFTAFLVASDSSDLPMSDPFLFKCILLSSFLIFGFIIYKSFAKLKRVEFENDQLYITNYFKTISVSLEQVTAIREHSIGSLFLVSIKFNNKTSFGNKIRFICDKPHYQYLSDKWKGTFQ